MNHPLENVLAGMAALLIVGTAMTAAISVPPAPATAPVQTDAAALALPVLA